MVLHVAMKQFTEGTTTKKYCVKEEITETRTAETIKGEFTGAIISIY